MATYIDPLFTWKDGKQYCHMISTSDDELYTMAKRIGLKREWLHVSTSGIRHFDLTPSKRRQAVVAGAIEITGKQLIQIARQRDH